ncbi:MAG TPA: hypothetical protein VFL55_11545 [Acetobacteraceae bacterium]|nr:hypothetical protein [Acetobacteraceae bacterium]
MPFDATGFERDPSPQRRRSDADYLPELVGLLILPFLIGVVCWSGWIVWLATTDAVGIFCCAVSFAYVALAIAALVLCWPRS